jgi:hypothetical protein
MNHDERAESVAFRWVAYSLIKQLDLRDDCLPDLMRELQRERALVRRYLLERSGLRRAQTPVAIQLARRP